MARCKGIKADGTPCRSPPHFVHESGWCDSHNPEMRDEMTGRAMKGGSVAKARRERRSRLLDDLPDLDTLDSIRDWLQRAGQAVALGDLDHRQAHAMLKACDIAAKMLSTASAEEIAALRDELRQASKIRRMK